MALLLFVLVLAGAGLAAALWPPTYSSTGTILIEQQELPADLVRSTVSTYASQRIQIITQRVMTTENLIGIIQHYNLYADMRRHSPREEIVSTMRKDTVLQMISADVIDPRDGRPTKATIAFSLTYRNRSPQIASQVANELVSLYLQQNIESREKSSRDAAAFLAGESSRLNADIEKLQAKLATFKAEHANELPDLSQVNLSGMNRADDEIRDTNAQLQAIDQQLLYLNAQLVQISPSAQVYTSGGERVQTPEDLLKTLRSDYTRESAMYSADYPDVQRLKREIEGLEASTKATNVSGLDDARRQLQEARTKLAAANQRYAPDYPDVIKLKGLVDSLQANVDKLQSAPKAPAEDSNHDGTGADNPVYIQLRTQREALLNQQQVLRDKRVLLQGKSAEYEQRLAKTPAVERDYTEMLRDINSAQGQYALIRAKQTEADIAENLETERKGEHFTLIEPPLTPEAPTSPNRKLIMAMGVALAFAAALGSIVLMEALDGSVRGRQDLHNLVSVPPLAVIPLIITEADQALRRRRRRTALVGALAGMVLVVIAVHLFYRPLDVLWAVALQRLGV
jgi:polysaccharide biosynthesis transport protein